MRAAGGMSAENAGDCIIVFWLPSSSQLNFANECVQQGVKTMTAFRLRPVFFLAKCLLTHWLRAYFRALFLNRRGHPIGYCWLDVQRDFAEISNANRHLSLRSLATFKCPQSCHLEWWPFGCCCRTMFTTGALSCLCVDLAFCEILISSWPIFRKSASHFWELW